MDKLMRFGVSMDAELLREFDSLINREGYITRSEALRDLVRDKLIEESIELDNSYVFGALVYIYDHHKRELEKSLTSIQHEYFENVISTSHVHVDHDHCLEVILLKGKAKLIKIIADKILSLNGVKHGKLTLTKGLTSAHSKSKKLKVHIHKS